MKDRLSLKKLLSLSMMLFALFFGAGNMIFPPAMGQAAGTNVWIALAGFIFTDVGLPVLCIAAVVFANDGKSCFEVIRELLYKHLSL